jgi:hypothetical protein
MLILLAWVIVSRTNLIRQFLGLMASWLDRRHLPDAKAPQPERPQLNERRDIEHRDPEPLA